MSETPSGEPILSEQEKVAETLQSQTNVKSMGIRAYLDQAVVPILTNGMSQLVKERPEDPVQWLATYLIENNPNKS